MRFERRSLNIVNAGVKVFHRNARGSNCPACVYRILQSGVKYILPYMDATRKVSVTGLDMKEILENGGATLDALSKEAVDQFSRVSLGPCVCVFERASQGAPLPCVVWRGRGNAISVMVNDEECASLLEILLPSLAPSQRSGMDPEQPDPSDDAAAEEGD